MTKKTINTTQYTMFFNHLNAALGLAYKVRVLRLTWPDHLRELEHLETRLQNAWIDRGFTEAEVKANGLTALSWDLMQLGWSERRDPLEVYEHPVAQMIIHGLEPVAKLVFNGFDPARYPFADRHRFADLTNPIDIEKTLRQFIKKGSQLGDDPDSWGGTPISKFIPIRPPIPIIPGAYQHQQAKAFETPHIGLLLKLDLPERDIENAINDFRFHLAEAQARSNLGNGFANRVFQAWALGVAPETDQDAISLVTQIAPVLAGLHAYDTMMNNGGSQKRGARAIAARMTAEYFREGDPRRDSHKVGQWLDTQRRRIEGAKKVFLQSHGLPS